MQPLISFPRSLKEVSVHDNMMYLVRSCYFVRIWKLTEIPLLPWVKLGMHQIATQATIILDQADSLAADILSFFISKKEQILW